MGQYLFDRIDRLQQEVDPIRGDDHFLIPHPDQDVLGAVRHILKLGQSQKTAGSLDGMNRPEDARQEGPVRRLLLQGDELLIEPLDPFRALH
ncbi:MAG: hypothetical protein MPW15_19540 [Candidatus Manganitrophus sp.]|nr:hypothetical protein [Candidatus Manganitrophus sp.]